MCSVKKAKVVYIDMDDTLADFWSAARSPGGTTVLEHKMWDKDFFLNLEPTPGSKGAVHEIIKLGYDVWILSQPLAECPESYSDKAKWIQLHFPQLYKKIILTQDKSLKIGDYLIDDNRQKWQEKFEQNGGKFIHFNYGGYNGRNWPDTEKSWREVVEFLTEEARRSE
jgi:5'(3')-deoxyribonucleotidase